MTGLQCQQSSLVIWIGVSGHQRARNARYGGRVPCLLSELGCVGRGCGLEFVSPKEKVLTHSWSWNTPCEGRSRSWSTRVDAAEAKKADGASMPTLRIPRPPSLTGR